MSTTKTIPQDVEFREPLYQRVMGADPAFLKFLTWRRALGVLGLAFPWVIIFGKMLLDGGGFAGSLSKYYYTGVRDLFVGMLCIIAVFLVTYKGYKFIDDVVSTVAGFCAIGVGWFPTTPPATTATTQDNVIATLHFLCAFTFFAAIAYISIRIFTRDDQLPPNPGKPARNRVYRTCGYVIIGAVGVAFIAGLLDSEAVNDLKPMLWGETVAVMAFGVSWLTKGETWLHPKGS